MLAKFGSKAIPNKPRSPAESTVTVRNGVANNEEFLFDGFERYLEEITARFNSKLIAYQTLKSYRSSSKTLLEFVKMYYGTNSIRLDKIDRGFFSEFESFLMVKKGLNENTANKVAKHFDRFICYAYERDWII